MMEDDGGRLQTTVVSYQKFGLVEAPVGSSLKLEGKAF